MADATHLPEPDSEQLAALVGSDTQRLVYGLLHRRRDSPPSLAELRLFVADSLGEDASVVEQRLRELRRYFKIQEVDDDGTPRFLLSGWSPSRPPASDLEISDRRRAEILLRQRCGQCGKTPLDDGVKLVVDYRVPPSWGGDSAPENLQPLCEQCRDGKRDYYKSFESMSAQIRAAIGHAEPQKRIGELMKALDMQWVRSDLIAIVASAQSHQEDWHRRLRDLRFLGWDYEFEHRYDEGSRVTTYYRLLRSAPWPEHIPEAIRAEAVRRRKAKTIRSAGDGEV
jgi:hypothetical protein